MSEEQTRKHVMLSYEWAVQKLVLSVYDYLAKKEIPVWMDIKAGIPSSNVYDGYTSCLKYLIWFHFSVFSIAEAIENSACFVCFMTPGYQQSDFCKQELQYAKERKISIIPLKLEEEWSPSGWLGK
jgi:hypothetical protein